MKNGLFFKILFIVFASILLIAISACGGDGASTVENSNIDSAGSSVDKPAAETVSKYPEKNIEFIVGYDAGGGYSEYALALAPYLEKHLPNNVNVIVRHMPGAANVIAANHIHTSKPDGYTIGIYNMTGLALTQIVEDTTYDMTETTWIGTIDSGDYMGVVSAKSGINSITDLDKNKTYRIAAQGLQSSETITGVLTLRAFDIDYKTLNHTGTSDTALSIIRGDADLMWGSYESMVQYIKSGDLKPIIFHGKEKFAETPDAEIPADLGKPELSNLLNSQRTIGGPPGMPEDVVNILRDAFEKAVHDPEFVKTVNDLGRPIVFANGEETTKAVKDSIENTERFKDVVKELLQEK